MDLFYALCGGKQHFVMPESHYYSEKTIKRDALTKLLGRELIGVITWQETGRGRRMKKPT